MRIYLDESKRLWEWKIIIWWFFTYHNTSYIEKFIKDKKYLFNIPLNAELKSTKKYWKEFLENISVDENYNELQIYNFWFKFENYFYESEDLYVNILLDVLIKLLSTLNIKKWEKINIFHDNLNSKNNKNFEKKVEIILNQKFWIKSVFKIHNSKKYLGLQLADLIVWEYRNFYFYDDIDNLDDFILKKDFKQQKT